MGVSALNSALSSSEAAVRLLRKSLAAQVNLGERVIRVQAEQEKIAAKLDNIGIVVDLYA
ncbi:hypothetical protein ACFL35_16345 [Candidatus Riflebacteria bacterium]